MIVLITGAAGNLGGLLARHLLASGHELRLMDHRTALAADLVAAPNVRPVKADLAVPSTLQPAVEGADVVVHFAGRLFAPRPETFLPATNTRWFANLTTAAIQAKAGGLILASFPHVEGPTSVEQPATGRLDRTPISVHAQTRLEEERFLLERARDTSTTPVRAAIGNNLRARHSDGGRGAMACTPAAAVWLASAHTASVAVDRRFPAQNPGGD